MVFRDLVRFIWVMPPYRMSLAALVLTARALAAQNVAPQVSFVDVGSENERVLRVLQLVGDVPLYPMGLRQLSPAEVDRLRPIRPRGLALLPADSRIRKSGHTWVTILPIEAQLIYNSAFPYGYNDGPIWAGRGVTAAISAGVAARIGPLSAQFEPMFFDAQNASFPLKENGVTDRPFWDGFYPGAIDLPQRFGNAAYSRFDFGQSTVRLDLGPLMAEASAADQWWGPAMENPLILGNNAGGFPHVSLGSSHPINIGIGSVHGRAVWGRLEQSAYSPDTAADSVRFMAGFVGSFSPRGVPGLELGATRFFHVEWPQGGFFDAPFTHAFEGILKQSLATPTNPHGESPDNQLASIFLRWVFPGSRFELYGEYGREDHNANLRDFWQEPDHDAGYVLGIQRAWSFGSRVIGLRAEVLNTRISHLFQGREQAPWYIHSSSVAQGHTVDGQLLAAAGGYGGAAANLAIDWFRPGGRWTVEWSRIARATSVEHEDAALRSDVMHSLSLVRWHETPVGQFYWSAATVWDLNRDFRHDRFNLNVRAGTRLLF